MAASWEPALDDVARLIPTRTRDAANPGSDDLLGTFTSTTTPTDGQAQAVIDAAVVSVTARTGQLDSGDGDLLAQARTAVAWRAAADIELGYPNREADIRVYDQLDARAKWELTQLLLRLQALGEGTPMSAPAWSAPAPPVYADRDPGDYTRPLGPGFWGGVDPGPI